MVQIALHNQENPLFSDDNRPVLLYAGQIHNEPEWTFPIHKHDDLTEMIYISQGQGDFTIGGTTYRAGKGDILVYNRGVLHEERSDPADPLQTYFCGIGNLRIEGLAEGELARGEPVIHAGKYRHRAEQYISDIFEELHSQVPGYELICQSLLISLIILVRRIQDAEEPSRQSTVPGPLGLRIKEYIDKNYTKNIPLSDIANHLYISPYYLSHIFKEEIGYSPINYLIQRRIGEAKKLLLTTNASVQQIGELVGYDNTNYFSMLFKKATGDSPSRFRAKNVYHPG